jgi:hypothetical protein
MQPVNHMLKIVDPDYSMIDRNLARRMTPSAKMAVVAAKTMSSETGRPIENLVFGTGTAGNEASMKFLKQMAQYPEDKLTPGDFVQSTPNAVATQVATAHAAFGYNMTHVHGGLSFENALQDTLLLLQQEPGAEVFTGAVDELSEFGYRINVKGGWYADDPNHENASGTIAGEGCCLFLISGMKEEAIAEIRALDFFESANPAYAAQRWQAFLHNHGDPGNIPYTVLSGKTTEPRSSVFYDAFTQVTPPDKTICVYKHLCGEYPTATAFGTWLATKLNQVPEWSVDMHLRGPALGPQRDIVLLNTYKAFQHSFIWLRLL